MEDVEYAAEQPSSFWQAVTDVYLHPRVETFERHLPQASLGRSLLWMAIVAFAGNLFNLTGLYILYRSPQMVRFWREIAPPSWRRVLKLLFHPQGIREWGQFLVLFLVATLVSVLLTLLGQLFTAALNHLAAKLMGGEASFTESFFVITLADLPAWLGLTFLNAIGSIVRGLVPWGVWVALLLSLFSFLLLLYLLFLESLGLAAAHTLSIGQGIVAALAPVVVGVVLSCCFYGVVFFGFIAFGWQ